MMCGLTSSAKAMMLIDSAVRSFVSGDPEVHSCHDLMSLHRHKHCVNSSEHAAWMHFSCELLLPAVCLPLCAARAIALKSKEDCLSSGQVSL